MKINPLVLLDGYKTDHRRQYPDNTEYVYSNFTPRKSRVPNVNAVVVFGLQYFLKEYLIRRFNDDFFGARLGPLVDDYRKTMDDYLGKDAIPVEHVEQLHSLGFLPMWIKSLPEGTLCPIGVPMLTMVNTHPDFGWLTNQLETILSATIWGGCTSATTAYGYRKQFDMVNADCKIDPGFAKFQGHDFSFRGMFGLDAALISGAGHLTSFVGTDTIPAIKFIEEYYPGENGLIGCSVPATEHSVMCMGGKEDEIDTYRRLITKVYPKGIVSIVSDTWDFWKIMTTGVRKLYDDIMTRDGKVVFRPDSGDPVKIICGDPDAPIGSPECKGAYQCLFEVFGGKFTLLERGGYSLHSLDSHVGLIYGDAITRERQVAIQEGLIKKGFIPDVVLGIGSYSYQYVTRDTYGGAVKATWGMVSGESREVFKSPKTDKGLEKKSAKGLLRVDCDENGRIFLKDQCTEQEEVGGLLEKVYFNSSLAKEYSLADIRRRLHGEAF